jgi:hypothetical protein
MVFGTPKAQVLFSMGTPMRIGQETRMIGNQPLGLANFLVGPWCVDHLRSKIVYLSAPPKPNMLPPQVDALNCYG